MVNSNNNTDLIGVCKVPLRGLILNNEISGQFVISNEEGNAKMGDLEVSIVAKEIFLDSDDKKNKGLFDENAIMGVDPLVVRLAAFLRDKGLNMNSAFNIFDKDNEEQISKDNFRSIIYFNLQFTKRDDEISKLIDLMFKNKVVLDRQDFYKIFNNLLPIDNNFKSERKNVILDQNTEINLTVIDKKNYTTGAINQMNQMGTNNLNNNYNTYYNTNNNIFNNPNTNATNNKTNLNVIDSGTIRRKSRSMREIMLKVDDFMFYFGKRTAADLFKIFDQDENFRVGLKELADGFSKMQIALNPEELEMIWKHIVKSNYQTSFDLEEFIDFYNKHKIPNSKAK